MLGEPPRHPVPTVLEVPLVMINRLKNAASASEQGFTLIELLVVIIILGILLAIAGAVVPVLQGSPADKSRRPGERPRGAAGRRVVQRRQRPRRHERPQNKTGAPGPRLRQPPASPEQRALCRPCRRSILTAAYDQAFPSSVWVATDRHRLPGGRHGHHSRFPRRPTASSPRAGKLVRLEARPRWRDSDHQHCRQTPASRAACTTELRRGRSLCRPPSPGS